MMAGEGERTERYSKMALPGLGVAKVSELRGDQVSPAEGKCLLGEGASAVGGHGVQHGGQKSRGCHISSARRCTIHTYWGSAVLKALWAIPNPQNMSHERVSFGSLPRESPMIGLWEGQSGMTVIFSPICPPRLQCVREERKEDPEAAKESS